VLFYYPINAAIQILYIWFLFNTTCFGSADKPSSGRTMIHENSTYTQPDDGSCGQPKHVVISNKIQIYYIYSCVYRIVKQNLIAWKYITERRHLILNTLHLHAKL
jgi:hypothetical protein